MKLKKLDLKKRLIIKNYLHKNINIYLKNIEVNII